MVDFPAQGGNTDADVVAAAKVAELIAAVQPGTMVNRFILIVESIDGDGDKALSSFTSMDLTRWESMGMLHFALQCENDNTRLNGDDD